MASRAQSSYTSLDVKYQGTHVFLFCSMFRIGRAGTAGGHGLVSEKHDFLKCHFCLLLHGWPPSP